MVPCITEDGSIFSNIWGCLISPRAAGRKTCFIVDVSPWRIVIKIKCCKNKAVFGTELIGLYLFNKIQVLRMNAEKHQLFWNKFSISVTRTVANLCYLDKKWYGCIGPKVLRTKEQKLRCSLSFWTHPWEFFEKFGNFDKNQWKSQFLCLEKGKDIGKIIEWRLF